MPRANQGSYAYIYFYYPGLDRVIFVNHDSFILVYFFFEAFHEVEVIESYIGIETLG
jgi:hypothetical protein